MNRLFVAFDGDNIGAKVGQSVLMDDLQSLHDISNKIENAGKAVAQWVAANGGQMISMGGDEGTFFIDPSKEGQLEEMRQIYQQTSGGTVTVGVGYSLSQAGKSLIAGKLMGKDILVRYDQQVEHVLEDAHSQAQSGQGSIEAQKQDEHYLSHMDGQQPMDSQENVDEYDMEPSSNEVPSNPDDQDAQQKIDAVAGSNEENPEEQMPENEPTEPNMDSMAEDNLSQDMISAPEQADASEECNCEACQPQQEAAPMDQQPSEDLNEENNEQPQEENQEGDEQLEEENQEGNEQPEENDEETSQPQEGQSDEEMIEIPENESVSEDGSEDEKDEDKEKKALTADESKENSNEEEESTDLSAQPGEDQNMEDQVSPDMTAQPDEDQASPDMAQPSMDDQAAPVQEQPTDMDILSELLADAGSPEELKGRIAAILQKFKANRENILGMKAQNPEMYSSIILMLKQMIDMAKQLSPMSPPEDESVEAPVQEEAPFPKQ